MISFSRTHRPAVVLCAWLLLAPDLGAQQPTPPTDPAGVHRLTLREALERFERGNLDLLLARQELEGARARVLSAGARPNPGLGVTREQLSGGGEGYHETIVTLGQTLELGGQRGMRRASATRALEAAEARVAAARLRLAFDLHRAYVRAAAAESNLAALRDATAVFRQVEESGRVRFTEGDISRFDRGRLQVERVRYENLLGRARLAVEASGRELAMLVAADSLAVEGYRVLPAEPLAALLAPRPSPELSAALLAAASRAEVRAAEAEIEAARSALALQRRERVPDLTLSAGFKEQAGGMRGAVLGASLPVPLLDRNRGRIAEARAELDAATLRRDLTRRRVENEVRRAWETYRSFEERVRAMGQTLLPESAGLLETARVSYAEGEMTLLELLDAADAFRSAREAVNELLAEYLVAVYDLERASGRLVPPSAPTAGSPR